MKMKKSGFTLAEILVTLAIVGVVAALTIPSLNINVSNQKIGPTLAKFVNEFENGINLYMVENDIPTFSMDQLSNAKKQWMLTNIDEGLGVLWSLKSGATMAVIDNERRTPANDTTIGTIVGIIEYDLNGNSLPNEVGKDLFYFVVNSSGHLFPVGGQALSNDIEKGDYDPNGDVALNEDAIENADKYAGKDKIRKNELDLAMKMSDDPQYQTGRIADNGWTTKGLPFYN